MIRSTYLSLLFVFLSCFVEPYDVRVVPSILDIIVRVFVGSLGTEQFIFPSILEYGNHMEKPRSKSLLQGFY